MIQEAQQFYCGYSLTEPVGNNAFSYAQRTNKEIYVSSLISGTLVDLAVGDRVVFAEVEDGQEKICYGLKNFVHLNFKGTDVFIFDNHNHAFFFWFLGLKYKKFAAGLPLVHVDQHKDTREPETYLSTSWNDIELAEVFQYTNTILNVGNFIPPALNCGLFSEVHMVNSSESLQSKVPSSFVLDLDLDIFAPNMEYLDFDQVLEKVQEFLPSAAFVTVATSPYFITQETALDWARRIYADYS